jgi:ubiquinone/menaquinone biosynthesis C-methylase UbiE
MADPIFQDPRLAEIYDAFDGPRTDLDHYVRMAQELRAQSILDIGCGTGCLAIRLCKLGFEVTAIDPARASLNLAQQKKSAEKVRWLLGDTDNLALPAVDLAVMTGNVAQVFLTDREWTLALENISKVLKTSGHFIFETRNPAQQDWAQWTKEKSYKRLDLPKIGVVEAWCEVTKVSGQLVHFRWSYLFKATGETLISDSTIRFREREEIETSLKLAGYSIHAVREAPDRPGKEFVFIASLN